MKVLKKALVSLLAVAMVCTMAMALVACGGGSTGTSGGSDSSSTSGGTGGTGDSGTTAGKTEMVPYQSTSEALAALQAGNIEAVVFDEPVAAEQVATNYTDAEIIEVIPTGEQYGFAVSKDNPELKDAVNWALAETEKDGTFAKLFEQYFPGVSVPKVSAGAPDSQPDLTAIKLVTAGTLTIGSDCDYPPFISVPSGSQTPAGFEYDLMQAIGEKLGLEVVYLPPQAFDTILASVAAGTTMDLGVSSFTINDERKELVDFCTPYFDSNQAVVALKSSGYTSVDELKGKKVGAQSGTTGAAWIQENL